MISVCIATYNGEKYIREQIESILPQLSVDDEVIISDDGSTDSTLDIIHSINDDRIKIYINSEKHGFVGNFENSLNRANGNYIFLSDQDDVWMANKIEKILPLLKDYDLIVHDAQLIDGSGKSLKKTYFSTMHHSHGILMNLYKTRFLGCCMAFRKEILKDVLPFPTSIVGHDYWIGMYSLMKYKVLFSPEILISYRRHGENASPSSEKSHESLFYKFYQKRFLLLLSLINRLFGNK